MTKLSSVDVVFDAIMDLHNNNQVVTREVLVEASGIERGIVDNCVKTLIELGKVIRLRRGVYSPAIRHAPSRPVSKTIMPDGGVIIEVGDDMLRLTPAECRHLANMLHGDSAAFAAMQSGYALSAIMKREDFW